MSAPYGYSVLETDAGVCECRRTPGAVLLDVRDPFEVERGSIPGSVNIPFGELNRVIDLAPTSDIPLFVYCQSGVRSRIAAEALAQAGYANVIDIGGIESYTGSLA